MADRKPGRRSPTPLSALLSNSFRGRPLEKRLGEVEIWRIWEKVVGSQIASKAQPFFSMVEFDGFFVNQRLGRRTEILLCFHPEFSDGNELFMWYVCAVCIPSTRSIIH